MMQIAGIIQHIKFLDKENNKQRLWPNLIRLKRL